MPDDEKQLKIAITASSNLPETAAKDSKAIKEVGKETGETTEKMELLKKPVNELGRITSELDQALGGLGETFRILRGGALGAVGGIIAGFAELKEYISSTNAALDAQAEKAANADFLPNIEDKISVLAAAAAAAQAYSDKLKEIVTGEQSVSDKLKEQLDLDKALELARATQVSAQKGLDIANVQADENQGKITPEQAAERRAAIEKKYIAQVQQDREAAQDQELKRKQDQLQQDKDAADDLAKKQQQATQTLTDEEAHQAQVKANLPDLNQKMADAQGVLDAAQATLNQYIAAFGTIDQQMARASNPADAAERQRAYNLRLGDVQSAQATISTIRDQLRQFTATQTPEAATKLQADKDAADEATRKLTENTTQMRELTDQIRVLNESRAQERPIERATAGIREGEVDAQERARQATAFEEDAKFLNTFVKSDAITPETLAKARQHIQDMDDLLKNAADVISGLSDRLAGMDDLRRAVAILQSQSAHASTNTLSQ